MSNSQLPAAHKESSAQTAWYMVIWIILSNCTILFNKWLIDTAGFRKYYPMIHLSPSGDLTANVLSSGYPILLTSWHLFFASIVTQVLARTSTLLDSRHSLPVNRHFYLRTILPIGLVSSGSLACSNLVYLYLSVSFIQMLKAFAPVVVLFVAWLWGITNPTTRDMISINCIVLGVVMASFGEITLSWIGLIFQLTGLVFEAIRVIMIQTMVSRTGMKMDPLVGLFYYAPVCAGLNLLIAGIFEIPSMSWEDVSKVGGAMLYFNALLAFLVNLVSLVLIKKTSALVTCLTGIFKNILLIGCSVIIWHTQISKTQLLGYSISLLGLVYYSLGQVGY